MVKAGDRSRNPRPAVSEDQLTQLVSTNGWRNESPAIARLGWAFPLMVPSECLPLPRQRAGEDLSFDDRLERKAVIGLSGGKLAIELNWREHMAGGSKLVRA